jgi:2-acetylphloroglucinol acetyltransferase
MVVASVRRVAIVGVGQSKFNYVHAKKKGWKSLINEAAYTALKDANMEAKEIDGGVVNYHGENWLGYGGIGPTVSDELGMCPVGFTPIVAQCTGGGVTAMHGWTSIASGLRNRVMCIAFDGEDCISNLDNYNISDDTDWDYMTGLGHMDVMWLREQAYYRKYNYGPEVMAKWIQQCIWYANRNPIASRYKDPIPRTEEMLQTIIPGNKSLTLGAQANRWAPGMGAAAFILVPAEEATKYTKTPIYLDGVEYGNYPTLFSKDIHYPKPELEKADATELPNARWAAEKAYKMAGIEPEDISIAQVYANTMSGILLLEALQVCPVGRAGQFVSDGETEVDGKCPTCTDGGTIGLAITSGAEVGNMIVESVHQLRGDVDLPSRQVKDPKVAVCGGYQAVGSGCTVTVLTNRKDRRGGV